MRVSELAREVPTPSDAPEMKPERLRSQTRDNGFDLINVIPAPREEGEKATAEYKRLEVAHLHELFLRDTLNNRRCVDLFSLDHARDRGGRYGALDSFAVEILLQSALGCARAQDFCARVLLGVFRVVEQAVIDKAADRVIRVRRRVLLLDQFFSQRARRIRTRPEEIERVVVRRRNGRGQSASSTSASGPSGGLMPRTVFTFSSTSERSAGLSLRYIFAFSRP